MSYPLNTKITIYFISEVQVLTLSTSESKFQFAWSCNKKRKTEEKREGEPRGPTIKEFREKNMQSESERTERKRDEN